MPSDREHAVVLGGSMGGLLAARVLSDHFDRVTIVERDKFPAPGENRRGVPQGRHAHLLLASGAEALEQLFPGFREEAVADGALTTDIGEIQFTIGGIEAATFPSGLMSLQVTRPRLEAQTRRRVISLPNVEVREACAVEGLQAPSDGARVTGIRVEPEGDAAAAQVDADLIVDATGRGSRSPRWLEELRLRGATGGARRHRPALHDPVLPPPAGTFRGGGTGSDQCHHAPKPGEPSCWRWRRTAGSSRSPPTSARRCPRTTTAGARSRRRSTARTSPSCSQKPSH